MTTEEAKKELYALMCEACGYSCPHACCNLTDVICSALQKGIEIGKASHTKNCCIPTSEMMVSKAIQKGRELELERIENDIDNLKTFIAGKHRFWKCKCGGWHYGEVYTCPLELERERIGEELLKRIEKNDVIQSVANLKTGQRSVLEDGEP